jgi:glycosyltransferase involved in cell wall biosynthesis
VPNTHSIDLFVPGDPNTSTGGYIYNAQILAGLADLGWRTRVHSLDDSFPRPAPSALRDARAAIASLQGDGVVVIDGLALAGLERVLDTEAKRLPVVALIHHPLALETGLDPAEARLLETAERAALALVPRVICTSHWTARTLATYGVPIERVRVVEPGVDRRTARAAVDRPASRTARAAVESASRETPEDRPRGSVAHIPVRSRSREALSTSTRAVRRDQRSTGGAAARDTGRSSARDVRLLCVATVTPRKGHAVLLEALGELRDRRWHLTCAGSVTRDPATFAALEHQVERLALRARVSFLGDLDSDALEREYERADLFVLASHLEGYGMALAEAVARGIPVVSTTAGAIPETVPAAAGVLVPPGDSRSLAKALAGLLDHDDARARLAANACAAAATLQTWRTAAERFAAALEGAAPARIAR